MKYILLLAIFVYILIQGIKNFSKTVLGVYSLVLSIPVSATQYIDTSSLLKIGRVNVLEVAVLLLFVLGIIKRKRLVLQKDSINVLALCLMGIYVFKLIINIDKTRCIADAKDYIIPLLLFFCMRTAWRSENSFDIYLETTLKALRINAIMIFLGYFIYWIPSGLNGRYGFGCESLYVFSIPMQLYLGMNKSTKKEKIRNILGVLIQSILVLISQTRSLILCLFIILGCYLVVSLLKRNTAYGYIRKFGFLVIMIIIGVMGYNYILNEKLLSGWMYRMAELFRFGMKTKSNTIRLALIQYYIPKICKNPFGYGFGVIMPVLDFTSADTLSLVSGDALAIDNLLITYIYKLGIVAGIIYITIHVISFCKMLKIKIEGGKWLIIKIACLVLVIPTVLMSVQALKYLSIASFYWGFVATIKTAEVNRRSFKIVKKA